MMLDLKRYPPGTTRFHLIQSGYYDIDIKCRVCDEEISSYRPYDICPHCGETDPEPHVDLELDDPY